MGNSKSQNNNFPSSIQKTILKNIALAKNYQQLIPNIKLIKRLFHKNWDKWVINKYDAIDYPQISNMGILGPLGITQLTLNSIIANQYQDLETVLFYCPNLKKLTLKNYPKESKTILQTCILLHKYKKLEQIEINNKADQFIIPLMRIPQIKRIVFSPQTQLDKEYYEFMKRKDIEISIKKLWVQELQSFGKFVQSLQNIHNLNSLELLLNFEDRVVPTRFQFYFHMLPKSLKKLTFQSYLNLRFQDPCSFVQRLNELTQLQCLAFHFTPINFDDKAVALLKTDIKQLRLYDLKFDSDCFERLCMNNKKIKKLFLSNCRFVKEYMKGVEVLCLQSLRVSGIGINQGFKTALQSQPQLLSLTVKSLLSINKCLMWISELSQLEYLKLHQCNFVQRGMTYLRRLRKLKVFVLSSPKIYVDSKLFVKLILNLKMVSYVESQSVTLDKQNRKEIVKNINKATRVWLRKKEDDGEDNQ